MKIYRLLLCLCCLLYVASLEAQDAELRNLAKQLDVPCLEIPVLEQELHLEKHMTFDGWGHIDQFQFLIGNGEKPPVSTDAFVALDANNLYVAIKNNEFDMSQVPNEAVKRDGNVWKAEHNEVLVLPGIDARNDYYQFAINPAGSFFDAKLTDASWNCEAQTIGFRDQHSWTVVIKIPQQSLGIKPGSQQHIWRINMHRFRPDRNKVKKLDLAWSPTRSRSNHVPSRFALMAAKTQAVNWSQANKTLKDQQKFSILLKQEFNEHSDGFKGGVIERGPSPGGSYLKISNERSIYLQRNFGDIRGLKMAGAYACNADQKGVVVQGTGTVVRACRPGRVTVLGRGLKVAQQTCISADGFARAYDLGLDSFKFVRPYGHCQQSNMPPTPEHTWAVFSFDIDNMYTNDGHRRVIDMNQQYTSFRISLNSELQEHAFLKLAWLVVWRGDDEEKPTAPAGFSINEAKTSLSWSAATDNLHVSHYEILRRDGEQWSPVTTSTMLHYAIEPQQLGPGAYALRAVDLAGNQSALSNILQVQ